MSPLSVYSELVNIDGPFPPGRVEYPTYSARSISLMTLFLEQTGPEMEPQIKVFLSFQSGFGIDLFCFFTQRLNYN